MGAIAPHTGNIDAPDTGYQCVKNIWILNNTLVNCDRGIRMGLRPDDGDCPPENMVVANNIFYNTTFMDHSLEIVDIETNLDSVIHNMGENTNWDSAINSTNTIESNLLQVGASYYKIISSSPAVDASIGSYDILPLDLRNGIRTGTFDRGAEELNAAGSHRPYSSSDTLGGIGATSGGANHCYSRDLILDLPLILEKDYQTKKSIFSRGVLDEDANVEMISGQQVVLFPGFSTQDCQSFLAKIEVCSNLVAPTSPDKKTFDNTVFSSFQVFPNPAIDFLTVKIKPKSIEPIDLQVLNVSGQVVNSRKIQPIDLDYLHTETINISHLTPGIYFLKIDETNFNYTKKILILPY